MNEDPTRYRRFADRYERGEVPWDHELPPPEVIEFAATAAPGRALDLGCGYGRAAIYLARLGWQVTAIDFVPQAIEVARERAAAAGVADKVDFQVGSVLDLAHLDGDYDFALDVGCMHAFDDDQRVAYVAGLARRLRPGAFFMLFTRLASELDVIADDPEREGPPRPQEKAVRATLKPFFSLAEARIGETQVEDNPIWKSAWFWCRRLDDA